LIIGQLSWQVGVLAAPSWEVAEAYGLQHLQGSLGGERRAKLGQALTESAFDEQSEHAKGDVCADLEVAAVVNRPEAHLALDDAKVSFDGVFGSIGAADVRSRSRHAGMSDKHTETIGASPPVPVSFVESELDLKVLQTVGVDGADVELKGLKQVFAAQQLIDAALDPLRSHSAAPAGQLRIELGHCLSDIGQMSLRGETLGGKRGWTEADDDSEPRRVR
jgi:hypothetical protein